MCRNYDAGECVEEGCKGRITCQEFSDHRCVEHSYNGRNPFWLDDDDEPVVIASTVPTNRDALIRRIAAVICADDRQPCAECLDVLAPRILPLLIQAWADGNRARTGALNPWAITQVMSWASVAPTKGTP